MGATCGRPGNGRPGDIHVKQACNECAGPMCVQSAHLAGGGLVIQEEAEERAAGLGHVAAVM